MKYHPKLKLHFRILLLVKLYEETIPIDTHDCCILWPSKLRPAEKTKQKISCDVPIHPKLL